MEHTNIQRIRISGASGSGKTVLTEYIASNTSLPAIHLDDVRYDRTDRHSFTKPRSDVEYRNILKEKMKTNKWVMEGSWYTITKDTYEQADIIVYLYIPLRTRLYRTVKRFFKRTFEGKYEGLFSFLSLCKYNVAERKKWDQRKVLFEKLYGEKLLVFTTNEEAKDYIDKHVLPHIQA